MKVMIVDDNEQNLYLLEVLLKSEKYEVVSARDGLEALEQLKRGSFIIIISDILMPRMDGFQLCKECKGDPRLKSIPFIFYTATYTDPKDEAFALSLGADRFIIKPIEPQSFLTTIREVIKEYEDGALKAKESPVKDEELYLAAYNKRLIQKLEKKMLDLEMAHKALAESEKKYRSIFENAVEGIFQMTPDGRYIHVNPALARMYGYDSPEEIIHSLTRNQVEQYVHPEDQVRLEKLYEERDHVEAFQVELYQKDKRRIWVSMNGRAVRDEAGRVRYYEGTVQDVTDRKQAEESLKQSERRYRQLSEENARLLEQARQDAQAKTVLLREVNHRVKNNLASIIGLIQVQESFGKKKGSPDFRSMCRDLAGRVQGLAMVHNLLSAAGWSSVKLTDLATEVIQSALQVLPPDERALVQVSPASIRVTPDQANTLALVINELATNTIKHGQRGKQIPSIAVRFEENEGQILLEFQDNGPGYPEPILGKERYNVGLHLVTNLVIRELKGEVTFRNDHGAVTRIQFGNRGS